MSARSVVLSPDASLGKVSDFSLQNIAFRIVQAVCVSECQICGSETSHSELWSSAGAEPQSPTLITIFRNTHKKITLKDIKAKSIQSGKYNLRASPVGGLGGMFATGNGTFKVVTVAAQVPGTFGRQTWQVTPVDEKDDIYTIVEVPQSGISLGGSWSLEDSVGVPSGPIITAEAPAEWYIIPTDNGIIDTYYIRPVTKAVGVDYYVGTNPGFQVVIVDIPINPSPPAGEIPYWQFNATSD